MPNFIHNNYYLDIDSTIEKCKTDRDVKDEDGEDVTIINVFKYELIKMMLDRVLDEFDDEEDDNILSSLKGKKGSISFNLAFNTLYHYGVIKEEEN
jgi:hypothetical protein